MHVYFVRTKDNANLIKIGVAADVKSRMETLQTGNPSKLELLGIVPMDSRKHALDAERKIHSFFRYYRVRGEWFRPAAPLREFVVAITRFGMPIVDAIEQARKLTEKHKTEYYNRVKNKSQKGTTGG